MPTDHSIIPSTLLEEIPRLAGAWRKASLGDAEFATVYFLHWQIHKHGGRFAARVSRDFPKPRIESVLDAVRTLAQRQRMDFLARYMERHHFLGVIPAVNQTLACWLRGLWRPRLCDFIPTPAQVLEMQVEGTRPVTVITGYPRMLRPVLNKIDAFEFMLHDLEHAYKYYHDDGLHRDQRALFALLQRALDRGLFEPYAGEQVFASKMDYLLSDMNTHAAHALRYLRAMFVDYFLRRDGKQWHEALSAQASREFRDWVDRLGRAGEFSAAQQQCLAAFFQGDYDDALALELLSLLRDFFKSYVRRPAGGF